MSLIRATVPVIASQGWRTYLGGMIAKVIHLLTLAALMLMPMGMSAAPAMAAPQSHAMAMEGGAGHCDPGDADDRDPTDQRILCALACAMVLTDGPAFKRGSAVEPMALPRVGEQRLSALRAEIDPPPPKFA